MSNDIEIAININFQYLQISLSNLNLLCYYFPCKWCKIINIDGFWLIFAKYLFHSNGKRRVVESTKEVDEHAKSACSFDVVERMLMLGKFGVNWIDIFLAWAKVVDLADILIVCNEFFEEDTDMLCNDGIKLLSIFRSNFLVVLNDPIKMVASDSNFIEYEFKEQFQKTENMLWLYLFIFILSKHFVYLFNYYYEVFLVIVVNHVN